MQIPQGNKNSSAQCFVFLRLEVCAASSSQNACGLQGVVWGGGERENTKQETLLHTELMMFNLSFKHQQHICAASVKPR